MKIKVSDYIADFLVKKGIKQVFSVTGGGAMHLNDSLGNHKGLDIVYNHHEQACAVAAEGYARVNGDIAAVCVTTGPGGTNAITGVMGAWLDSIPMFVISGQVKYETTVRSTGLPLRQLGDQEFDIVTSVKNMTKYAEMVTVPLEIGYHLERAYHLATTGRFGPVWLDIPLNIQGATIETDDLKKFVPEKTIKPSIEKQIKQTIEALKNAKRPVLFFGSGIRHAGAKGEAIKLAEKLNIPVVTSFCGHDLLPGNHPLFSGRPGTIGTRAGNFVVQNADVLIVLGSRLNIRHISYNWENFAKNAKKIVVDIDEVELKKPTIKPDIAVCADVKDFIIGLDKSGLENISPKKWLDYCAEMRGKYDFVRSIKIQPENKVNPYYLSEQITRFAKDDEVFVAGNASATVCTFQSGTFIGNQKVISNSGAASMGHGLPAAMGACVAKGGRVVCLDGDGSIMMNLQELQTVAGYNMDLVIFLYNNNGYISIQQTQDNFFKRRSGADPKSGVTFPDFEKIALAFGLKYFKIHNNGEVEKTVKKVYQAKGPVFCEVFLDENQGFQPKLSAKKLPDGTMVSPSLEDMSPFLDREEFEKNMSISKE